MSSEPLEVIKVKPPPRPAGNIYAVQARGLPRIKFGFALNVESRIKTLRTGSPVELDTLASIPADRHYETAIHRLLKHERVHLEWFEGPDTERMVAEIKATSDFLSLPENCYVNPAGFITHFGSRSLDEVFQNGELIRNPTDVRVVGPDRPIEPTGSNRKPNTKSVYRRSRLDTPISADGDKPWGGKIPAWHDKAA